MEYLGIYHLSKRNPQNELIISRQTCINVSKVHTDITTIGKIHHLCCFLCTKKGCRTYKTILHTKLCGCQCCKRLKEVTSGLLQSRIIQSWQILVDDYYSEAPPISVTHTCSMLHESGVPSHCQWVKDLS
jgi:hypothetical protein